MGEDALTQSTGRRAVEAARRARRPSDIPKFGWLIAIRRLARQFGRSRIILISGGVSFFVILSAAPAMAALISVYALFADASDAARHIDALAGALPADVFVILREQIVRISQTHDSTLAAGFVISFAIALWVASNGMRQFCSALTLLHEETADRPLALQLAITTVLTIGAIAIFALAALIVAALPSALAALQLGGSAFALFAANWAVLVAFSTLFGAVVYRYGPDRTPPRWRWCWPGALAAAGGWVAMSILFSLALPLFGAVGEIYGPLASVFLMMVWVQLSAMIFLIGGELNIELERMTGEDTTVGPEAPMGARGAVPADEVGPRPDIKSLRRRFQAERLKRHRRKGRR